jgi:hypothetical protein
VQGHTHFQSNSVFRTYAFDLDASLFDCYYIR